MGRPPEYDKHKPFMIWGIWMEAKIKGGFPHKNRTYWVKKENGDLELVYDSPNASKFNPNGSAYEEALSVDIWLRAQGKYLFNVAMLQYVNKAHWFEELDTGRMERRLGRLPSRKEATILDMVCAYAKDSKTLFAEQNKKAIGSK